MNTLKGQKLKILRKKIIEKTKGKILTTMILPPKPQDVKPSKNILEKAPDFD